MSADSMPTPAQLLTEAVAEDQQVPAAKSGASASVATAKPIYLFRLSIGFAWQIWGRALLAARANKAKAIGDEPFRVGLALLAHWSSLPEGVFVAHEKIAEVSAMTAKKVGEALLALERAGLVGKAVGGRLDRKGELQSVYLFRIDPNDLGADDRAKAEKWIDASTPPVRLVPPIKSRKRPTSSSPSGGMIFPSQGNEVGEIICAATTTVSPSGGTFFLLTGESDQPHDFPCEGKILDFSAGKSICYSETTKSKASPSGGTYIRDIKEDRIIKTESYDSVCASSIEETAARPAGATPLHRSHVGPPMADPHSHSVVAEDSGFAGEPLSTPEKKEEEPPAATTYATSPAATSPAATSPAASSPAPVSLVPEIGEITSGNSDLPWAGDPDFSEVVASAEANAGESLAVAGILPAWRRWQATSPEHRALALANLRQLHAEKILSATEAAKQIAHVEQAVAGKPLPATVDAAEVEKLTNELMDYCKLMDSVGQPSQ